MAILTGSAQDPNGREGLMNMTADLLEQGSAKKSATEIADEFAQLGSSFNNSVSQDFISFSTSGLSATKTQLAGLFAEVLLTPTFSQTEEWQMAAARWRNEFHDSLKD
jgi:zinc protease